jgi:hypothetical protein
LDVCNIAGAALSVNTDTTVIQECFFDLVRPAFSNYVNPSNPDYLSLMLASKQKRPPKYSQ